MGTLCAHVWCPAGRYGAKEDLTCGNYVRRGKRFCYLHDPDGEEHRAEVRKRISESVKAWHRRRRAERCLTHPE